MKKPALTVVPFALVSVLLLAACAGDPSNGSTSDPSSTPVADLDLCATPGGDTVDSVTVTGELGQLPVLDYTVPLAAPETTERALVIDGGVEVGPGTNVEVLYTIVDATTGETLDASDYSTGVGIPFRADITVLREGFARTIACVGPGSRVVGVIPAGEGFGSDSGIGEDDVLIFIADVITDLSPAEWTTDVPAVGGTAEAPTVTLPGTAPKSDLELVVLKEGDGSIVGGADSVTVNYLGTAWETGEIFDESYSSSPATFSVTGVVEGFSAALIGQRVGSRVLVTMPPELGYGAAGTSTHALAGLTLVFLIDIVSTTPAG